MKNMKVKNVVIGKQFEASENYREFINIVNEKKINLQIVNANKKVNIEKNLYFNILWPSSNDVISDNVLNNNSLVCKLVYNNFSMLFTGDIEELAESQILKKYDKSILQSSVLKVAHHGSKTSSTEEFIKKVRPKIALIGVGKNNNFGHPNAKVLERLNNMGVEIYRTDDFGEIIIEVNRNSKVKIRKQLN